jgi:hypothetical protein
LEEADAKALWILFSEAMMLWLGPSYFKPNFPLYTSIVELFSCAELFCETIEAAIWV